MITDDLIRKRFIHDTISQGINQIYAIQENVVQANLKTQSGQLKAHLSRRPFSSTESDTKQEFFIRTFAYLRFLDIHYRREPDRISRHIRSNLALYNRAIWGVLYHETFPQLRYGFNDEIRSSIRQELEQALQYEPSNS